MTSFSVPTNFLHSPLSFPMSFNFDISKDSPSSDNRKRRVLFNDHQVAELEKAFRQNKYLNATERDALAKSLGLKPTQVSCYIND